MDSIFDALFTLLQVSTVDGSVEAKDVFQAPPRPWAIPRALSVERTVAIPAQREWLQLEVSDFSSSARTCVANTTILGLEFTAEDIKAFSSKPLSPIGLDRFTEATARISENQDKVLDTLPFSLEKHRQARQLDVLKGDLTGDRFAALGKLQARTRAHAAA